MFLYDFLCNSELQKFKNYSQLFEDITYFEVRF